MNVPPRFIDLLKGAARVTIISPRQTGKTRMAMKVASMCAEKDRVLVISDTRHWGDSLDKYDGKPGVYSVDIRGIHHTRGKIFDLVIIDTDKYINVRWTVPTLQLHEGDFSIHMETV